MKSFWSVQRPFSNEVTMLGNNYYRYLSMIITYMTSRLCEPLILYLCPHDLAAFSRAASLALMGHHSHHRHDKRHHPLLPSISWGDHCRFAIAFAKTCPLSCGQQLIQRRCVLNKQSHSRKPAATSIPSNRNIQNIPSSCNLFPEQWS